MISLNKMIDNAWHQLFGSEEDYCRNSEHRIQSKMLSEETIHLHVPCTSVLSIDRLFNRKISYRFTLKEDKGIANTVFIQMNSSNSSEVCSAFPHNWGRKTRLDSERERSAHNDKG